MEQNQHTTNQSRNNQAQPGTSANAMRMGQEVSGANVAAKPLEWEIHVSVKPIFRNTEVKTEKPMSIFYRTGNSRK